VPPAQQQTITTLSALPCNCNRIRSYASSPDQYTHGNRLVAAHLLGVLAWMCCRWCSP
jgi:hypothetical protein